MKVDVIIHECSLHSAGSLKESVQNVEPFCSNVLEEFPLFYFAFSTKVTENLGSSQFHNLLSYTLTLVK